MRIRISDLLPEPGSRSSPEADYPAAHSMDTLWYAVDAAGHVAAFDSGPNGSVPDGAEHVDLMYELSLSGYRGARPVGRDRSGISASLGIYFYEFDDAEFFDEQNPLLGRYRRQAVPDNPLHVDQLPPGLRRICTRFRFDRMSFSDIERAQPMEQWPCRFWRYCAAFVLSDGTTIRLVPGREEGLWDWFGDQLLEPDGDLTRLQLEGVDVAPDRITFRSIPGDPAVFWAFYRRLSREHSNVAARFYFELNSDAP